MSTKTHIIRGHVYWSPNCTRLKLNTGIIKDLGCQSWQAAKQLAERFKLELHKNGTDFTERSKPLEIYNSVNALDVPAPIKYNIQRSVTLKARR